MASWHRCDQCGDPVKVNARIPVQIGQPEYRVVWGEARTRKTLGYSMFEFCGECATQLALAFSQKKRAIQRGEATVRQ